MVKIFRTCSERTISKINQLLEQKGYDGQKLIELDLEAEFSNLVLDIIGLGVFNYDFGSVTKESHEIKGKDSMTAMDQFTKQGILWLWINLQRRDIRTTEMVATKVISLSEGVSFCYFHSGQ
ncbi:hypothetical protein PIB30_089483 [Stylosanthes scabra]|uniref:Uncharacterized protein n=1 Tax=Stylosanthes scabra TaxID=79078 RepID=A0ABU6YSZ7_9FABA|nr:hypothetical protein [Stylosanthes scabra]